jgi:hypothetical protein
MAKVECVERVKRALWMAELPGPFVPLNYNPVYHSILLEISHELQLVSGCYYHYALALCSA